MMTLVLFDSYEESIQAGVEIIITLPFFMEFSIKNPQKLILLQCKPNLLLRKLTTFNSLQLVELYIFRRFV